MIRDFQLFPLDRCCEAWSESVRRNSIQLTVDGYTVSATDQRIASCPFCGGDKQGRIVSITPLTT